MANDNSSERSWSESDSRMFIDRGRYYVPQRERQIATIAALVPTKTEAFHIMDLCCGTGLLSEALLKHFPNATVHGYDGSDTMREHARSQLSTFGERFQTHDFDLAASDWRTPSFPVHAVVSSLCIHHLRAREKQTLYRDVYQLLQAGGVFLIADLVQPLTAQAVELAGSEWEEAVRHRALDLDGNTEALEQFHVDQWNYFRHPDPVDRPSPIFHQLQWLTDAGFIDVDVFWLLAGHAVFGGSKKALEEPAKS